MKENYVKGILTTIINDSYELIKHTEEKMKNPIYYAEKIRPECNEENCFTCPYFDHKGHCLADEEINDCDYCKNAFTDRRLDETNDTGYMSIGRSMDGFRMSIDARALGHPPVSITLFMYQPDIQRNVMVAQFTPKYCPMCGRKITENEPFLNQRT